MAKKNTKEYEIENAFNGIFEYVGKVLTAIFDVQNKQKITRKVSCKNK